MDTEILRQELDAAVFEVMAAADATANRKAALADAFAAWEQHHTTCRECFALGVLNCVTQVTLFARYEAAIYLRRAAEDREAAAMRTAQIVAGLRFDAWLKTPEGEAKFPGEAARRAAEREQVPA